MPKEHVLGAWTVYLAIVFSLNFLGTLSFVYLDKAPSW